MKSFSNFQRGSFITAIIIFIIAYPFFTIKYFQTDKLISTYLKFTLLPITILLLYLIYKNKNIFFINLNNLIQKILLIASFITVSNLVLSLLFVSISTIINCNIGSSKEIYINSEILNTKYSYKKNGRLRYYISFRDEKVGYVEDLEVYESYQIGDYFIKKMEIGSLGLLYSK